MEQDASGGCLGGILLAGYFLPTLISWIRKHPNQTSIAILNLFLGWTFIGWVVALVWAVGAINRYADDLPILETPQRRERDGPFCAEPILANAKVCKHCGRDVVPR